MRCRVCNRSFSTVEQSLARWFYRGKHDKCFAATRTAAQKRWDKERRKNRLSPQPLHNLRKERPMTLEPAALYSVDEIQQIHKQIVAQLPEIKFSRTVYEAIVSREFAALQKLKSIEQRMEEMKKTFNLKTLTYVETAMCINGGSAPDTPSKLDECKKYYDKHFAKSKINKGLKPRNPGANAIGFHANRLRKVLGCKITNAQIDLIKAALDGDLSNKKSNDELMTVATKLGWTGNGWGPDV